MSKPRWIDSGVFKTLRNATRNRTLAVVVGPKHGSAEIASRRQLKEALGDADRSTAADDPRCKSDPDEGLRALFALRQPGIVTTSVSDALTASVPEGEEVGRVFDADSKGLKGAWDRKGFIAHLSGRAAEPSTLVLTQKDRKALIVRDSRYQAFLRATFHRSVLFSGFALDDPDLVELLEDVSGVFNGHVSMNIALVPAGTTDPATALRASMHYGTTIVEFPPELGASKALAEIALLLEDLEIPKPATGNPPGGFTELTQEMRGAVAAADEGTLDLFDRGNSSSWESIQATADAPRAVAGEITEFLLGPVGVGQVNICLVRGADGQGKTTLLRRVAWDMAGQGQRVFWREFGAGVPDRYVPEEKEGAMAFFVADDADQLDNLPSLLNYLSGHGQGKARLLLAADRDLWDRSGLDHRIRRFAKVLDLNLGAPTPEECSAMAEGLSGRKRLAAGLDVATAAAAMAEGDHHLMDRIASARGVGSIREAVSKRIDVMGGEELLKRAYLGVSMVHRFSMSLGRGHLARLLGIDEGELDSRVLSQMGHSLIVDGGGAVRTRHPVVAAVVCDLLAPNDEARDAIAVDLLSTLPGGSVSDNSVFHAPSELIRMLRQFPVGPLTLTRFFEAGEDAATNDVQFWFDRGRCDVDFNRYETALHYFDSALWRHPGDSVQKQHNATVHSYRARCLMALERKKEALSAVEDGLRFSSRDSTLLRLRERLGGGRPRGGRDGGPRGGGGRGRGGRGGGGGGGGRGAQGGGGGGGGRGDTSRRGPTAGAGRPRA